MIRVHRDFDLTRFTSFGVPARCAAFVEWDSVDDLRDAIADDSLPHPLKAIGGGSNLLFVDTFKGSILFRRGATGAARTLDSLCEEMVPKAYGDSKISQAYPAPSAEPRCKMPGHTEWRCATLWTK